MTTDPRDVLSNARMGRLQVSIVAITVLLNAMDGFDVLAISLALPGIAADWGVSTAVLGYVVSMEIFGMAIASMVLGGVADRIGRRPTILGCLMVMVVGMFMATTAQGVVTLSIWRVVTGLGIGGILATAGAVAAEFSSARRRHLSVSLMSIGYPIGGALGSYVVRNLLVTYDWRAIFYLGAATTVTCIPLAYFFMPESVHWLARKQPAGALERINRTLARMGHAAVSALPAVPVEARKRSTGDILTPGLRAVTLILTVAYFFHIGTYYFILKWVPTIVVNMGFDQATGAGMLTWVNVGGMTGGLVLGLLTSRVGIKALTVGVLVLTTAAVALVGRSPADLTWIAATCAVAGFFGNAGIVGLYAIFAHAFPTHVRAFGTGFVIGVGRGGAALAPIVAGYLFDGGSALSMVALVLGLWSLCAAGVLAFLKIAPEAPAERPTATEGQLKPSLART